MITQKSSLRHAAQRGTLALVWVLLFVLPLSCGGAKPGSPTAPTDTTPPSQVQDVAVATADSTSITISWTAPGGDGQVGTASAYDIRYGNTDHVASWDWTDWAVLPSPPAPHAVGTTESVRITGLTKGAPYVIALRTRDAAGGWSAQSNIAEGYTSGYRTGPVVVVSSQSFPYARVTMNGGRTWANGSVQGANPKFGWLTRASATHSNMIFACAPTPGQNLLGDGASRIWMTVDYGLTWEVASDLVRSSNYDTHGGGAHSLVHSSSSPSMMFVSVTGGCDEYGNNCCGNCSGAIYSSSTVGQTWNLAGTNLPRQPFPPRQNSVLPYPALAINPGDPSKVYIGGRYFCYDDGTGTACFPSYWRSTDGGATWVTSASSGLLEVSIFTLAVQPSVPSRVFASTDHGIYRSVDAGITWTSVSSLADSLPFMFDPSDAQRVYTPKSKSADGGQSWSPMPTPLGARAQVEIDPTRHELYAVGEGGLYRSADDGATWRQMLTGNLTSIVVGWEISAAAQSRRPGGTTRHSAASRRMLR
ncbi:MAG: fibronectin type III domain-containing protein [Candidatus Eisenbacteria bacterium]